MMNKILKLKDSGLLLHGIYVGEREQVRKLEMLISDLESNLSVSVSEINRLLTE